MGSMAQPRSRVKYSIDPNVLNWAKNENKFGQKLMEKMGWQDGKGLGANEDGMTDFIKVRVRSDNRGLGFDNKNYNNVWLDHQDDFDAVLKSLNESNGIKPKEEDPESPKINALEDKSKNKTRKLHYGKFARSKDLSSRSSTDLDLILGRHKRREKKLQEENSNSNDDTKPKEVQKIDREDSDEDSFRPSFALQPNPPLKSTTDKKSSNEDDSQFKTNPMSIGDYFARKMNRSKPAVTEEVAQTHVVENRSEEVVVEVVTSKVKKDKKKRKAVEEDKEEEKFAEGEVVQSDSELAGKKSKKKSKKSKKSKSEKLEEGDSEETLTEVKLKVNIAKDTEECEEQETTKVETIDVKNAFKGSNLEEIYGYTPYNITCTMEDLLNEKSKRVSKKRSFMSKNLEIDAKFYDKNKKKMCT